MAKLTITDKSSQADIIDAAFGVGNTLLGKNDRGGVPKRKRFTYTNDTGAAITAGLYLKLANVGPGLITDVVVSTSALGTSRVLNIGTQEYTKADGTVVASDIDALLVALDVSSAVTGSHANTQATSKIATDTGLEVPVNVDILAQVTGGTIPTSATISGFIDIIEY